MRSWDTDRVPFRPEQFTRRCRLAGSGGGGRSKIARPAGISFHSHFVQRARHGETFLDLRRLGTHARVVRQLGHDLRVVQMGLAVHLPRPDALAARDAARAPVVRNESETQVVRVDLARRACKKENGINKKNIVYSVCGEVFCWPTNRWA